MPTEPELFPASGEHGEHFRRRLTPEEALRGVTVNAAKALGLNDRGTLETGQRADLCVWNVRQPAELCYWIGGSHLLRKAFIGGLPQEAQPQA